MLELYSLRQECLGTTSYYMTNGQCNRSSVSNVIQWGTILDQAFLPAAFAVWQFESAQQTVQPDDLGQWEKTNKTPSANTSMRFLFTMRYAPSMGTE